MGEGEGVCGSVSDTLISYFLTNISICQEVKNSESDLPFIVLLYNKIGRHDHVWVY